jgi:putative PIN family toxin of toxin-antitoxin system
MNIVLDTNTVISGLFWKGAPRQVLDLARSGTFTLFTSPDLLAELGEVLERQKFFARLVQANVNVEELVLGYASLAITVRPHKIAPVIKADPDDDKVLACAKTAKSCKPSLARISSLERTNARAARGIGVLPGIPDLRWFGRFCQTPIAAGDSPGPGSGHDLDPAR